MKRYKLKGTCSGWELSPLWVGFILNSSDLGQMHAAIVHASLVACPSPLPPMLEGGGVCVGANLLQIMCSINWGVGSGSGPAKGFLLSTPFAACVVLSSHILPRPPWRARFGRRRRQQQINGNGSGNGNGNAQQRSKWCETVASSAKGVKISLKKWWKIAKC